jgi:hypothetical protein
MSYDPFEDLDDIVFHDPGSEEALDVVNQHIDTFIQIGKCGWDMCLFTFDEDPTELRVALKQRIGLHTYMTQMFGMVMVT